MKPAIFAMAAALIASGLAVNSGLAQDAGYRDDRSSASALVHSLYNAINRREYARAWDYFGDAKPAADFEAFAQGYEATSEVTVLTGNVASEGAAGSTFYHLPVAIRSIGKDGGEQVFAGCYTARLISGAIQEPPFRPLHLEKGALRPTGESLEEALPAKCPDAPAPDAAGTLLRQAQVEFGATHGECEPQRAPEGEEAPGSYAIPFRYRADSDEQPMREARLFRFFCSAGAYNISHIYYLHSEPDGLRELQFATPDIDVRYVDDNPDGQVDSVSVIGFLAADRLVNSAFDAATLSIASHSFWRGVGDASSSGLWIFRNGDFTLVKYEVDASYDGEINPEIVMDYETAP